MADKKNVQCLVLTPYKDQEFRINVGLECAGLSERVKAMTIEKSQGQESEVSRKCFK